jgi:hypothetical protein
VYVYRSSSLLVELAEDLYDTNWNTKGCESKLGKLAILGDAILSVVTRELAIELDVMGMEMLSISNDILSYMYDVTTLPFTPPEYMGYTFNKKSKGTFIEAFIATIFLDTGKDYAATKDIILSMYGDYFIYIFSILRERVAEAKAGSIIKRHDYTV